MSSSRHADGTSQRLHLLVGLVVCVGLGVVATSAGQIAGVLGPTASRPSWSQLVAFACLVAVGELVRVQVRVRSTLHSVTWADAAILIGLAIMPSAWVVLVTAVGITVGKSLRRLTPIQIVFGAAKEANIAFVGGMVLLALGAAGSPDGPVGAAPLALAFLAMTPVDMLLVIPVVALASRTRVVDRIRDNPDIRVITLVGRFGVAAAAVLALEMQPLLLYALPLLILVLHLWHERWVRAREERQAWQNLASATEKFTGTDLDVVLRAAVTEGAKLFSAEEIEVEVWLPAQQRLVRGDAEAIRFDGDPAEAPADATNVYAVALHGYAGQRDIGALRLRFRNQLKISDRDRAMLQTYAAGLDTAVRNAAAYGRLGAATAAHAHAAAHDPLTALANRRELERQLTDALAERPADIAMMLIDLKEFKEVNDALGHLAGDRVLVEVARRLREAAGPDDLVCRFGGDEFAVLLRHVATPPEAERRARGLLAGLAEPVPVDGLPIVTEASAGLAMAASDEEDGGRSEPDRTPISGAELMRRADVAMYQARRTGQALVCYDSLRDPKDRDRLALSGQLAQAVARREFVLHFQPIVDLATGEVLAAEALARWRHPTRGELTPRWFLDLLERSNQLPEFTAAILDDALAAADTWRAAGHDLAVSVNISARSLLDVNLPRQVLDALDSHHTEPANLCLELTETLAISHLDAVDRVLGQLRDLGVRLALDDFGTGFSSLAGLSRVPVHQLKIDRGFITTMHADMFPGQDADPEAMAQARAVVRSTVQLGRTLDLTVVAEGIETDTQRHSLWELGCAAGQGHLFARAIPADQLLSMLTRGTAGRPGTLARPLHRETNVVRLSPGRAINERRTS